MSGRRAVTEAVRAGRATEILVVSSPKVTQGMRSLLDAAQASGVPIRVQPRARLDALATDHQGVVARLRVAEPGARVTTGPSDGSVSTAQMLTERDLADLEDQPDAIAVVLDGISDPQNLGAAARSAEAAGAAVLVTRTKRAADVTPAAVRASAGALLHLPHARVANIARSIERLQDAGFWVVGLDGDAPVSIIGRAMSAGEGGHRHRQRRRRHGQARARAVRCARRVADARAGGFAERGSVAGGGAVRVGPAFTAAMKLGAGAEIDSAYRPAWRSPVAQAICNR